MSTLQQRIINENDIQNLYQLQIEVSEKIKENHVQIMDSSTNTQKSEAKGDLGINYSLLEMVKNKISTIKEKIREEQNEQNRINYNFRMAAKNMLKEELYDQLMFLAKKTRTAAKIEMIKLKN